MILKSGVSTLAASLEGRIVAAVAVLWVAGTVGYMAIEGWSALDAAFMTVLTFTTVGYQEVHPLSELGKIFSIFLMVLGVGV